jgi:hypothetical protein
VISSAPFTEAVLSSRRYTISFQKQKLRATLPEKLYDDLYWARTQFQHGMPVGPAMLHYRKSLDYALLTDVAPVLFNAALVSRLNELRVPGAPVGLTTFTPSAIARYMRQREGIELVSQGLAAARNPNVPG